MRRYARKCDITHEGMNEGWIAGDTYIKYEEDALNWCIKNNYDSLEEAYDDGAMYYTEWYIDDMEEYYLELNFRDEGTEKNILIEMDEKNQFQVRIKGYLIKVDKDLNLVKVFKGKIIIHAQNINKDE